MRPDSAPSGNGWMSGPIEPSEKPASCADTIQNQQLERPGATVAAVPPHLRQHHDPRRVHAVPVSMRCLSQQPCPLRDDGGRQQENNAPGLAIAGTRRWRQSTPWCPARCSARRPSESRRAWSKRRRLQMKFLVCRSNVHVVLVTGQPREGHRAGRRSPQRGVARETQSAVVVPRFFPSPCQHGHVPSTRRECVPTLYAS